MFKKLQFLCLSFVLISGSLFSQEVFKGEYIVQFAPNASAARIQATAYNGSPILFGIKRCLSADMNMWLVSTVDSNLPSNQVIYALRNNPNILNAQSNHKISLRDRKEPNDVKYLQQWDMNNTGQTGGTPDADIDAPEAWTISTGGTTLAGDTIVVAVIDGGFDLAHQDLSFWRNRGETPNDGIDNDGNGYIDDYNGWNAYNDNGNISGDDHGTHVAGTIGAKGDNNIGVTGVNWNAKVMAIAGASTDEATIISAYGYAIKLRKSYNETNGLQGAFVVATNSSFGVDFGQPADFPIWCALYDSLGKVGILSAGATINAHQNIDAVGDIPTACPSDFLISVTNTTHKDEKYSGAGYGKTTIDLGAPGTNILSTTPGNAYSAAYTGTSMATPHVAGAIGLMYSVVTPQMLVEYKDKPDSLALLVKTFLLKGVDTIPVLSNLVATGGRLNLFNSINNFKNSQCGSNILASTVKSDVTCSGGDDGSIFLTVLPGTYKYNWSTGDSTKDITGLSAGSYIVNITDSAGCSYETTFVLKEPDSISINPIITGATTQYNGSIVSNVSGGTPPYTYLWSTGATDSIVSELPVGNYSVVITDARGCKDTATVSIPYVPLHTVVKIKNSFIDKNDLFLEISYPQVDDVSIELYDIMGRPVFIQDNVNMPMGMYRVDLSSLHRGIYIIKLETSYLTYTDKLFKVN